METSDSDEEIVETDPPRFYCRRCECWVPGSNCAYNLCRKEGVKAKIGTKRHFWKWYIPIKSKGVRDYTILSFV